MYDDNPAEFRNRILDGLVEASDQAQEGQMAQDAYRPEYIQLRAAFILNDVVTRASMSGMSEDAQREFLPKLAKYLAKDTTLPHADKAQIDGWFKQANRAFKDEMRTYHIAPPKGMPYMGPLTRRQAMFAIAGVMAAPTLGGGTAGFFVGDRISKYFADPKTGQASEIPTFLGMLAGAVAGVVATPKVMDVAGHIEDHWAPQITKTELGTLLQMTNAMIENLNATIGTPGS